jgi:hypothetical protein
MLEAPYVVDKSLWDRGPWQKEPDRVDFVHAGLACLALRHPEHGSWCGYVGVPREHLLFGRDWMKGELADFDLDVHGGVTYTAPCDGAVICHVAAPGMPDDVWWIGFDCGHCWDRCPGRDARLAEMRKMAVKLDAPWKDAFRRTAVDRMERYRPLPYVRHEIEGLAAQLARMLPARMLARPLS